MPLTLEDIARMSGVSRSTVSRVINDAPNVRESTRQFVLEVIRRIDFQPNLAARGLAVGRTQVLALVIPRTAAAVFVDPYFPLLIQGVSSACNARSYSMMLWLVEPDYEQRMVQQIIYNGLIDGVIVASAVIEDPIVTALAQTRRIPFLTIGRHPTDPNVSFVDIDNRSSAMKAVEHLILRGRRRIGTVSGPLTMVAGLDRFRGYQDALMKYGFPLDQVLTAEADFSETGGYEAMRQLLPWHPDGLFAASDMMAIGALRAIKQAGLCVPENIAVVGFDDIPIASRTDPPLTTMAQPTQRCGAIAADLLIDMIENPAPTPRRVILTTELVVRASSGAVV